jgi:hypothetical protein
VSAPDWLVAKLGAKGDYELEGVKGNFKAKYASDNSTAVHMLSIDDYAESVEDPTEHSWVLLGEKPPAAPLAAPPAMLQLRGPLSPAVEPTPAAAAAPRIAGQGNGRAGPSSAASMAGPSSTGMGRTGREPLPAAAAPDMSMLATLDTGNWLRCKCALHRCSQRARRLHAELWPPPPHRKTIA